MTDAVGIIYIAMEAVIAVLAILGNILVIWVISLNSAFRKTHFIISLALADIAVGLVIPVAIVLSFGFSIPYDACLFLCCLPVTVTQASIMSLLAIATDRYLRVRLLNRYKIISNQKRIRVALVAIWLLSLLVGFAPMFGWSTEKPENSSKTQVKCEFMTVMSMEYMTYLSFFVGILVPLILMCILYALTFCIIRTKLRPCSMGVKGREIFYRQEYKTAKSLALVLFLFAVCWLPLCILNCVMHFNQERYTYVVYVGILLSHSNSVMNPIVYAFRIKKFRETCILILRTYILCMDPERSTPNVTTISENT